MSASAFQQDDYLARFFRTTFRVLTLRTTPMAGYAWPAWWSWTVLVLIDAYVTAGSSEQVGPLHIWALRNLVTTLVVYSITAGLLAWWMRRGDRWDGQGSMLALLAAADVVELLPSTLEKLGLPMWVVLAAWFYPLIASVRALTGVSKGSVGYCLAGMLLVSIPAVVIRSFGQWPGAQ
jgi:hypothetical protein